MRTRTMYFGLWVGVLAMGLSAFQAQAMSELLEYRGTLHYNAKPLPADTYSMTFRIQPHKYLLESGYLWEEVKLVEVDDVGGFDVTLGEGPNQAGNESLSRVLYAYDVCFIGVDVTLKDRQVISFEQQQLTAVPFALEAKRVSSTVIPRHFPIAGDLSVKVKGKVEGVASAWLASIKKVEAEQRVSVRSLEGVKTISSTSRDAALVAKQDWMLRCTEPDATVHLTDPVELIGYKGSAESRVISDDLVTLTDSLLHLYNRGEHSLTCSICYVDPSMTLLYLVLSGESLVIPIPKGATINLELPPNYPAMHFTEEGRLVPDEAYATIQVEGFFVPFGQGYE